MQRPSVSSGGIVVAGLISAAFFIAVICGALIRRQDSTGFASAEVLSTGGDVRLAVKDFDDGRAHFYRYATTGGRQIRFFVVKTSDGVVRAAFDGCALCYKQRRGYRQAGHVMVCNNCGRTLPSTRIDVVEGGCNPAPLERAVEADQILLKAASLELGAAYF